MSPAGTASVLELTVCAGIGVAVALVWRGAWSGRLDERVDQALRAVWPYGAPSRRGFARALPVLGAQQVVVGIMIALHAAVVVDHAPAVAIAAEYVGGVLILGSLVLFYTVMAFNKPKFSVAPHRRSEPGVSEERQAAWRAHQQVRRSQSDPAAGDPRGGAQTGGPPP